MLGGAKALSPARHAPIIRDFMSAPPRRPVFFDSPSFPTFPTFCTLHTLTPRLSLRAPRSNLTLRNNRIISRGAGLCSPCCLFLADLFYEGISICALSVLTVKRECPYSILVPLVGHTCAVTGPEIGHLDGEDRVVTPVDQHIRRQGGTKDRGDRPKFEPPLHRRRAATNGSVNTPCGSRRPAFLFIN